MKNGYPIIFFFFSTFINGENLALIKVHDVPSKSNFITQPLEEMDRLFVLNQKGLIYIIFEGNVLKEPFLDISDQVYFPSTLKSKEGLLGLAFDPNYKKNGYFYLHYIDKGYSSVISRFSAKPDANKAEKKSEKIILKISQSMNNYLAGHIAFGPKDNMLYIGLGSKKQLIDKSKDNQNLNTWLGSILRIDVNNGDPYNIPIDNPFVNYNYIESEIFCFGLKNPYRFSFDKKTNDLIIGDIGKNSWEEINWETWSDSKGANFGWPIMEGKYCYDKEDFCDMSGLVLPTFSYPNKTSYLQKFIASGIKETVGCSIIGGYVYRGEKHHSLLGSYIFGDNCSYNIWALRKGENSMIYLKNLRPELKKWSSSLPVSIASFGEDNQGELYVVDYIGSIYKFISN